jgi:hypothetical protein
LTVLNECRRSEDYGQNDKDTQQSVLGVHDVSEWYGDWTHIELRCRTDVVCAAMRRFLA